MIIFGKNYPIHVWQKPSIFHCTSVEDAEWEFDLGVILLDPPKNYKKEEENVSES